MGGNMFTKYLDFLIFEDCVLNGNLQSKHTLIRDIYNPSTIIFKYFLLL